MSLKKSINCFFDEEGRPCLNSTSVILRWSPLFPAIFPRSAADRKRIPRTLIAGTDLRVFILLGTQRFCFNNIAINWCILKIRFESYLADDLSRRRCVGME